MNIKALIVAPILTLGIPTLAVAQDDSGAMESETQGASVTDEMFSQMDSDGDGSLSQSELTTAVEDGMIVVGGSSDSMGTGASDSMGTDSSDSMDSESSDSMGSESSDN